MPDATARASAPSSLCVLPWIHLHGSVDGVWGRCCVDLSVDHDHVHAQVDKPDLRLTADALGCLPRSRFAAANPDRALSLIEAFNSPQLRQTRLAMLAGERPVACAYCYRREDAGVESYRTNIVHFPEHLSIGALDPAVKGVHRARLSDLAAYCRSDGRAEVDRHLEMVADFLAKDPHD
jgi:hypothetical protein